MKVNLFLADMIRLDVNCPGFNQLHQMNAPEDNLSK